MPEINSPVLQKSKICLDLKAVLDYFCDLEKRHPPDQILTSVDKHITQYIEPGGEVWVWSVQVSEESIDPNPVSKKQPVEMYSRFKKEHLKLKDLVFGDFPDALAAHFILMKPSTRYVWHKDTPADRVWRFHMPLRTNQKAKMLTPNQSISMPADGYLWLFDVNHWHSAENLHETQDRVHLTWFMPNSSRCKFWSES